jgi:hypothetical protein
LFRQDFEDFFVFRKGESRKKIFLVLVLTLLVLTGPSLSQDDEYHYIIWHYRDGVLSWYLAVSVKYDEGMASWILTDAARLNADDTIVRLLTAAVPKERIVSVEYVGAVQAEDLY